MEGANFVFERPFVTQEIRRALYAAYERMLGERRRYFRCALELPVLIIRSSSGLSLECVTMNVSSSGMAVKTATQLSQGEAVYISFVPPDKFTVRATGVVIWDDKHGKSGIRLQCSGPEMQHRLASWLDSQLAAQENLP
jgi:hypothetical protein